MAEALLTLPPRNRERARGGASHVFDILREDIIALRRAPGAPPDQLTSWFSALNVVISGWHLEAIRVLLRSAKNFSVTAIDPRYRNLQPKECFVAEIKFQSSTASDAL